MSDVDKVDDAEVINTEVANDRPFVPKDKEVVLPLDNVVAPDSSKVYSDILDDSIKNGKAKIAELQEAFTKGNNNLNELRNYLERLQLSITVVNAQIENLVSIQAKAAETVKAAQPKATS